MKYLLYAWLSLALLSSCHPALPSETPAGPPDPLDMASHDSSERPQNNFYLFANGSWLKKTVIPADQSSRGTFIALRDSSTNRLHRILDSLSLISGAPKGSLVQQTADLYVSAMDSTGIEKKGYLPVQPELDSIRAITSRTQLIQEIAREFAINHSPFFSFYVNADDRNSLINQAHFDQGGLGLPSRDYYFKNDSGTVKIRDAYKAYITRVFTLLGQTPVQAGESAQLVFNLETAMARVSKNPVALRDPISNYHQISATHKPELKNVLMVMGITADTILVGQPEFFQGLYALLKNTPLETLKQYLIFHVIHDDADYLSRDFADASFQYNRLLTGQKQMQERWKRMTNLVDKELGDNLGQIYVAKYFTPADKERISRMIDNIMSTFAERIHRLDWMSDSTKEKAVLKLHAIVKKVGYPDKWKDYSTIVITRDDIIANLRQISHYEYKRSLSKIGKPVDRTEWSMTPPTINAYYNPTQNNINFPAGILQPPFYFSQGDDAVNYGAIGVVIGHEITHGFDDQGRQYDGDGNLKDWWSPEDARRFKIRAMKIISQYNEYVAVDTFHLNGELTEGENIADNGGLAISYDAFKKTDQGKSNEKIDGFTPDQRFFLAHAQVWQNKTRKERLITLTLTNEHSAPMWRVNGPASNSTAFYEAFQVQPTDSMYRPDSLRVKIW